MAKKTNSGELSQRLRKIKPHFSYYFEWRPEKHASKSQSIEVCECG